MRLIVVLLVLLPPLARAQNITRQALVPLSNYVAQVSAQSFRSSNGFATNSTFYGLTNEGYTRILGDFNATGIALLSGDAIITDLTVSGSSLFVGPISIGAFDFTIGHLDNWSVLPTGAMANAVSATFLSNQVSAAQTSILFSSNYLQGLISGGGATLTDVTNVANSITSLASNALRTDVLSLQGSTNGLASGITTTSNAFRTDIADLQTGTNAITAKLDSNIWWLVWGSLGSNSISGKLDSNVWQNSWGSLATNALTDKASHADLVTASNVLSARLVANDTTTSNFLFSLIGGLGGSTDWSIFASTTNVVGVSNWVNSVSNLVTASGAIVSNGAVAFTMTASNTLRSAFVANDTTTSNGLLTILVANDTTTSNGVANLLVANDTFTSNALRTAFVANDTTTSNGAVAFTMTASNSVAALAIANDTTTSNALRTTFIANDTTTSNGVVTLLVANDTFTSNALNTAIIAATNAAQVTNWINFRQPASDSLTNWSLIPTGAMANVVSTTFLTNWANAVSNYVTAATNTAQVTNWINSRQPANAVLSNIVGLANFAYTNVPFGGTNITARFAGGTNYSDFNNYQPVGGSTSNMVFMGKMFFTSASFTNLNATGTMTNLANVVIPAHTLTNNGDRVRAEWQIKLANAVVNTNQFQIVYGSQTILDTGLQIASNTVAYAWARIVRTGSTAQHVDAHLEWGPSGGVPFIITNVNIEIVQTNGINTTLALRGGARRLGAHTNNMFEVYYSQASR